MTISSPPHFVMFPFMSQGHIIPLIHLSRILSNRGITVTIITTPANYSATKASVKDNDSITVIEISFDINTKTAPPGVEVKDKRPCMDSFINFVDETEQLKPRFEEVVESLPLVSCIISDGFLSWTQESAEKLKIPRFVFYGTNIFIMAMSNIMQIFKPYATLGSADEPFLVPGFPWLKLTANDFDTPFNEVEPKGPMVDFILKQQTSMLKSHGLVVNSFDEIEHEFGEYWDKNFGPKAWLVGPFCAQRVADSELPTKTMEKPTWMEWLDMKLEANESVLFVSFGTQAEVSIEQLHEVCIGLERSKMSFMWVVKPKQLELLEPGFEDRVKGRGKMVAEWVDQVAILKHEIVRGFLSHCGWNSMLESMCAGVAVLAIPLMAEQHLNGRLVVEKIGMGLRLWPRGKVARGLVEADEVEKMVVELMEGESGKRVMKRVNEVKESAYDAMKEGGSSSRTLDSLIDNVCGVVHSIV